MKIVEIYCIIDTVVLENRPNSYEAISMNIIWEK